jgi:hypothetical protein
MEPAGIRTGEVGVWALFSVSLVSVGGVLGGWLCVCVRVCWELGGGEIVVCEGLELDLRGVGGDLGDEDGGGGVDVRHFCGRVDRSSWGVDCGDDGFERPIGRISIGCLIVGVVGFVQGLQKEVVVSWLRFLCCDFLVSGQEDTSA